MAGPAPLDPARAPHQSESGGAGRSLADRVALVTGGGRGIGRAHVMALAARGAAVVVNDLGTSTSGVGTDPGPAEEVAAAVIAAGGSAVADHTDVASLAGGGAAVEQTLRHFGRIDIVVNNAGFAAGGGEIEAPDEAGIDALLGVHFKAALGTISAAFPHMRRQGRGRIITTVSEAALDPRFVAGLGYAAAKAALWSLTLVAARDGAPSGITANAVSPAARTRLNADLLDADFRGQGHGLDLDPSHVARLVAYLAGDTAADITGRIIHAGGGHLLEYTTTRTSRSDLVERLERALA